MNALEGLQTGARMFIFLIVTAFVGYILYVMVAVSEANSGEQTDRIEEVIGKALVQCYALEGIYPSDVKYLENYGIFFDDERYFYNYDMMATNIKPNISVFVRR